MVMAYALIAILTVTGMMPIIGKYLSPVMAIFGLPGEATVALIAAFLLRQQEQQVHCFFMNKDL